jgi:NAD-dependent dihydropyrimidine dehydrogenase PreA subunit
MTITEWKSAVVTIKVDYEKCVGYGECVDVCPSSVYELKDGKAVPARIGECIECCSCVAACPEHAIEHSSCI